jgi:hypothetical protein
MNQAIFHVVTGRWVFEIKEDSVKLCHDPSYVPENLTQSFGETKLHGIISNFKKNRDKFVVKSFEENLSMPYRIG